jgi:hypothetical protein
MSAKAKKRSPQGEFRALTQFEKLPPDHATFLVDDDGSEPHLQNGEYAVIDTSDREPAHGEIYLIQFSEHSRRYIKQLKHDYVNITGPEAEPSLVWWVCELRGFRKTHERSHGVPIFAGLSEGPYQTANVGKILIGRIVGYARSPLGRLFDGKAVRA